MSDIAKKAGISRQTNPSPIIDKADIKASFDDLGRQLTRPYQVRDLVRTAYANLATGTKTELKAGSSGAYFDLVQISCYNNSDVATIVSLYDESTLVRSIPIPATNITHINFEIPLKQSATGVGWYVDLPDITGTTIEVNAEFIEEI